MNVFGSIWIWAVASLLLTGSSWAQSDPNLDRQLMGRAGKIRMVFQNSLLNMRAGAANRAEDLFFSGLIWDPITCFDEQNALRALIVDENFQVLDDYNTSFQLEIIPDALWSDGSPVTSDDIIASFQIWNNRNVLERCYNMVNGSITQIEKVNDRTFKVHSPVSIENPLAILRLPIYPATSIVVGPMGDFVFEDPENFGLTNGPFLAENIWISTGQEEVPLDVNRSYPETADRLDLGRYCRPLNHVDLRYHSTMDQAVNAMVAGSMDFFYNWPRTRDVPSELLSKKDIFLGNMTGMIINMDQGNGNRYLSSRRLENKEMRKALDMLVDRNTVISIIMRENLNERQKREILLYGPWRYMDYQIATKRNPIVDYNVSQATGIFQSQGFRKGSDGYWLQPNGEPFTLRLICGTYKNAAESQVFNYIMQSFDEFGIKIDYKDITSAEYTKRLLEGSYDLAFKSFVLPTGDYVHSLGSLFEAGSSANLGGYNNPAVNSKLAQSGGTYDFNDKKAILTDVAQIISDDRPWLFLYSMPYRAVYNRRFVHNIGVKLSGSDLFLNVDSWQTGLISE